MTRRRRVWWWAIARDAQGVLDSRGRLLVLGIRYAIIPHLELVDA